MVKCLSKQPLVILHSMSCLRHSVPKRVSSAQLLVLYSDSSPARDHILSGSSLPIVDVVNSGSLTVLVPFLSALSARLTLLEDGEADDSPSHLTWVVELTLAA
jgi:hypothetical protein